MIKLTVRIREVHEHEWEVSNADGTRYQRFTDVVPTVEVIKNSETFCFDIVAKGWYKQQEAEITVASIEVTFQ